ncbi:hypothetical protein HQ520_17510 [bacterium]|nr:hypothetical protein [bacterium]
MKREFEEIELGYILARTLRIAESNWKPLLVLVLLVCLATAVVSMVLEPEYSVSTVIEPGIIGTDEQGHIMSNDTASNMAEKIRRGALTHHIIQSLDLDPQEYAEKLVFSTTLTGDAERTPRPEFRSVVVSYRTPDTEMGKKILAALTEGLRQEKDAYVQSLQKDLKAEISLKKNAIERVDGEIVKTELEIARKENDTVGLRIKQKNLASAIMAAQQKAIQIESKMADVDQDIRIQENEITALEADNLRLEESVRIATTEIQEQSGYLARVRELEAKIAADQIERAENAGTNILAPSILLNYIQSENFLKAQQISDDIFEKRMAQQQHKADLAANMAGIETLRHEIVKLTNQKEKALLADKRIAEAEVEKLTLEQKEGVEKEIAAAQIDIREFKAEKDVDLPLLKRDLADEIAGLEAERDRVFALKVVQPPTSSIRPVFQKKRQMVVSALVFSAFIGLILIAVKEVFMHYWRMTARERE